MSDYDVIVIGSGAGGGTLVSRLAPDPVQTQTPDYGVRVVTPVDSFASTISDWILTMLT